MRILVLAGVVAAVTAPAHARQERFLEDIRADYDISVRCAGVYGAAATSKSMELFE